MRKHRRATLAITAGAVGLTLTLGACGGGGSASPSDNNGVQLSGSVSGDGSSTVFPILEAVAEEFGKLHRDVRVQVGESGTGGGFEKFCRGEIDFTNASRPIKDTEAAACKTKGIGFTELKIAFDGLSVVTNKDLAIDCLTVEELKKLWIAGSTVKSYADIRTGLPSASVKLFGPGSDSGTYDYFLEEVLGKGEKFRSDFTASENDNTLVQGIENSPTGLGYFGFAYYEENQDKLNLVGVDSGKGCVKPSVEAIRGGTYTPLSRPLFVYVKNTSLAKPEVKEVMRFLVTEGRDLITEVGYVELPDAEYADAVSKLA